MLTLEQDIGKRLIDLFANQPDDVISGSPHDVHLAGYGYRWLRVSKEEPVS